MNLLVAFVTAKATVIGLFTLSDPPRRQRERRILEGEDCDLPVHSLRVEACRRPSPRDRREQAHHQDDGYERELSHGFSPRQGCNLNTESSLDRVNLAATAD